MSGGGETGSAVACRQQPDARSVARVERALVVEVADVVRGVARAREAVEAEHALADDVHVRLGHGASSPQSVSKASP